MPLPVIADTIRVAVRGTATNGHKFANILHFRKDGALSYAAAIALLDPLLLANYNTNSGTGLAWRTIAPASASLFQFEYTPLDGASATTVIAHNVVGLDAAVPLPASVCLVVTLRTATRGRSFRGRVYTGPYCIDAEGAGVPTAATVAAVATQWDRFMTINLAASGVSLGVASYHLATFTDGVHATADSRWDTQRRRLNT
jgi:hypothetical protein